MSIIGTSPKSVSYAIETAIAKANKAIRSLYRFEVEHFRGHLQDGKIARYQVALKVGFRLD